jgi:hypothetical protein
VSGADGVIRLNAFSAPVPPAIAERFKYLAAGPVLRVGDDDIASLPDLHRGQAESLLLNGERNIVKDVTIQGAGDALQTNGSAYFENIRLTGTGDTILGRGPAYFRNCEIASRGAFMRIRNTQANHGNVFDHCTFRATCGETVLARLPDNKGRNYPYAETVLLDASRQLDKERDAETITRYRDPAWVLGGWQPVPGRVTACGGVPGTVRSSQGRTGRSRRVPGRLGCRH